jgi:LPPG:FO 2-phospho-L-lactate transferase
MAKQKIGIICGGSGSSKFVAPLKEYLPFHSLEPAFIANVADNFWHYGVYICPDVDITTYCLSGRLNQKTGWGIKDDTTNFVRNYAQLNPDDSWFNLGDSDLAFCYRRTELINQGWKLSKVTEYLLRRLQIKEDIIPSTDDNLQTFILTPKGRMHLQEFWVKNRGEPEVKGVEYLGIGKAKPSPKLMDAIISKVLILPGNPVSSILPTLNLPKVHEKIRQASSVIAISPFLRSEPFSGPAGKFMRAIKIESSSFGVAKLYSDFIKVFLVHSKEDPSVVKRIKDLGVECVRTNIIMKVRNDQERIVNEIAQLI